MNILFLALVYKDDDEKQLLEKSTCGLKSAANNFQWKIIRGLEKNGGNVYILSSLPVATYPKFKQILMKTSTLRSSYTEVGYFNFPLIKQICRFINTTKQIRRWVKENSNNRDLIIYQPYLPFLIPALLNRIICRDIKITIINADLVGRYGVLPKNPAKRILTIIYGEISTFFNRRANHFVVLTEQMISALKIDKDETIVLEGIVDSKNIVDEIESGFKEKKIVLYSGSLGRMSNALELVEKFHESKLSNVVLQVCGGGDDDLLINEIAKSDERINFIGYLPSEKVFDLQRKADVLVSPRKNEEFAKYSFPSKLMEYLGTGKPVLAYKLDGIPREYDSYLFYFNDDMSMINDIQRILELPEEVLRERGYITLDFLRTRKTEKYQCARIIELLRRG